MSVSTDVAQRQHAVEPAAVDAGGGDFTRPDGLNILTQPTWFDEEDKRATEGGRGGEGRRGTLKTTDR